YKVTVELNGDPVVMELDTGASVTVVKLGPLKKTVHLRAYTGEQIPVIETVDTRASYRGWEKVLPMLVVKGHGPSLLGCDWLQELGLGWREILKKGLGTLVGTTAKLYVDSGVKPKYFKPRPLPYALREKVETELQRLESEGTIELVSFSEWATPIVPVVKSDKSIRICGNYKITVNQASELDNYPIPKTEDLLAVLGGGQKLTKLDMSQAYQQMILDKESRKFTTINTHKGLYQYTCLPYGVSSAPGIFQHTMEGLLQGISHVEVRIDDILIIGKDDTEHLKSLEAVLQKLSTAGLRLRLDKCCFLAPEMVYLGYKINEKGVHPVADKQAPVPRDSTQLRACLIHFDATKKLILSCEASPYGVGAVLSHNMEDRSDRPIGYASCSLTQAERRCLEPLAFAGDTSHYSHYGRLMEQWLLMEHLEGTPVQAREIKTWNQQDPTLSKVHKYILCRSEEALCPFFVKKNELSVEDGCILWGSWVVIPPPARKRALAELHEGHPGSSCMKALPRGYLWWPKMDEDLKITVKNCHLCQLHQQAPVEAPLHPWEWPERP
uniref:Gypsy retrotransposon integrase-like protein 1 n=1 Tax=Latimeria chalumnae TaxID=7897 RepID=H2ZVA1_LATCH